MRAIVLNEEKAFEKMLHDNRGVIEKAFMKSNAMLSGADAFRLSDTSDIPIDITQALAAEKGLIVDIEGYTMHMKDQKQRSSGCSILLGQHSKPLPFAEQSSTVAEKAVMSTFVGFEQLSVFDARILNSWSHVNDKKRASTEFTVILDRCPFYPEGGGQAGDRGHLVIVSEDGLQRTSISVENATKSNNGIIALKCSLPESMAFADVAGLLFAAGSSEPTVEAHVDREFRSGCAVHHTATHLLHRALKDELGEHVTQGGSQVASDRLRFDFSHFGTLSIEEMTSVEARVNQFAAADLTVTSVQMMRGEAECSGAICNFGDKFGDVVRVVHIGGGDIAGACAAGVPVSSELCGGTHVSVTRELFPFVLVSEGSVAAGMRRLEAVAGFAGARHLQEKAQTLGEVADLLSTTPAKVVERIAKMQK